MAGVCQFLQNSSQIIPISKASVSVYAICRVLEDSMRRDVNMGQKILLRLRPAFDRGAFLQQEDVIQTMLHEASL